MGRQNAILNNICAPSGQLEEIRLAVRGSNINEETLLATDYLNHFNEAVMLLELVSDMPDLMDEVKSWQPKSYQQHFSDSGLSIGDLAIRAYELAPARYRRPFDEIIDEANEALLSGIGRIEEALADSDSEVARLIIAEVVSAVQSCNDRAGAIINANYTSSAVADVNEISMEDVTPETSSTLDQDDIDALFD